MAQTKYKSLTFEYAMLQASFWMGLCVFSGFATVYLQHLGYTNTELGIVAAAGTLAGSLLTSVISSWIDRRAEVTASAAMPYIIAAETAALIALILAPGKGIITSIAYALYMTFAMTLNGPVLKLYSDAEHAGVQIDFGIARGIGSLGYVIVSFSLGKLTDAVSANVIPIAGTAVALLQIASFYNLKRKMPEGMETPSETGAGTDIATFLKRNRSFSIVLLGIVPIFICHNTIANFFINIVRNIGGDTADMGFLHGLMALIEVPVMLFYSKLTQNTTSSKALKISFVGFTLRNIAITVAPSVPALAVAELLQAPSFALYSSAIVEYIGENLPYEDSAKAQSLAFAMTMIGSVLASIISGRLFDITSVSVTMWIAVAIGAVGSVIAISGVRSSKQ